METSYFRFSNLYPDKEKSVYNSGFSTMLITTLLFTVLLFLPAQSFADYMAIGSHPEYVKWVLIIVALDTLATLPFSRLRHEGRPIKFAVIKVLNIIVNVGLVIFFLVWCKGAFENGEQNIWASLYDPTIDIGYVFIANMMASGITLVLLWKEIFSFSFTFDKQLLKEMMIFSAPLIIVGLGGMINETIDRFMITNLHPGTVDEARSANGIYSANAKLAVVITLFITAFRMGAEPFFFRQSNEKNAPATYARVMKFFVITCCVCFLSVTLFLDVWKYFMGIKKHPEYLEGLKVVPLLMLGKVMLGIYYNLSIWYKLTNKNMMALYITVIGAIITIVLNWILIPYIGYMGCAIASFVCYTFMMVVSFLQGQKYYPVPYAWKKMIAYIVICIILFGIHQMIRTYSPNILITHTAGVILSFSFIAFVAKIEKKEWIGLLKKA